MRKPNVAEISRESFTAFAAVEPGYTVAPHHRLISGYLSAVERRECDRLMVFTPPRHGKSKLVSGLFPAWFMGRNPGSQVIFATYSATYACDWGRKVRTIIDTPRYRKAFGTSLSTHSKASDRFELTNGAFYCAVGVDGPTTGRGADLLIIDDPIKTAEQALSPVYKQRARDWYDSVASTRLMPGGRVVLVMTRWSTDDLAGYLETAEAGRWTVLRLPAEAEEHDPLGRPIGAPLWPEWYDNAAFDAHRNKRWWSALYQQRPVPQSGNLFKADWWRFYDREPDYYDELVASWDLSFKGTDQSDYVSGQVWGRCDGQYYLVESIHCHADFPQTVRLIQDQAARYGRRLSGILIEDKANGPAVISTLSSSIDGIIPIDPRGSKESRAHSCTYLVEAGQVWLPRGRPESQSLIDECAVFPRGSHDDQVDAMTMALDRLRSRSADESGLFFAGLALSPRARM